MARVIILAGKLHPYGGIETHILHHALLLGREGADVHFMIGSITYLPQSIEKLREAGVRVCEFNCRDWPGAAIEYLRCLGAISALGTPGTILYSHGTSAFAYVVAQVLRPSLWIHHHHTDVPTGALRSFSAMYRRVLRDCDWLITCTLGHAALLGREFDRVGRTVCLPYLKAPSTARNELCQGSQRGPGAPIVLGFFGRLRQSKGVSVLIDLASWFEKHDIECRLHGDDCEHLLPQNLPRALKWLGPYDATTDLDKLLESVDLVVLPTTFPEGLPIVMTESISRGVPVVAYDGGGLREMANVHLGIKIIPPDVTQLKAAILDMIGISRDPNLSQSLMEAYENRFSDVKTVEWWAKILERTKHAR